MTRLVQEARAQESPLARAVRVGLGREPKSLPAWMLYDALGSALFEAITELDEYYLTRAELEIMTRDARTIVESIDGSRGVTVVELGAGTARKTEVLLRALADRSANARYVAIDISPSALSMASARVRAEVPRVACEGWATSYEEAFPRLGQLRGTKLVLFAGSSIGNYETADACRLLRSLRAVLSPGDVFVLGTDLCKDPDVMLAAYDDALGVTAAFNRNVLARINRELGGKFELERFRHVASWNSGLSRIEMHLESDRAQEVVISDLRLTVPFDAGERIHTESSTKYDVPGVDGLLGTCGFRLVRSLFDRRERFAVHVARAFEGGPGAGSPGPRN